MKFIVQHDEKAGGYLSQYMTHTEILGSNYKIIDVDEKNLGWLSKTVEYIEPSFTIELQPNEPLNQTVLNNKVILVTVGAETADKRIDAYYNMLTHTFEQTNKVKDNNQYQWIHCFSQDNKIDAAEYIKCIHYIKNITSSYHKPIIIYANIYVPQEMYRYRSLTYKIISSYLEDLSGLLISKTIKANGHRHYAPSEKPYESYLDQAIYLDEPVNDAVTKVIHFICTAQNSCESDSIPIKSRQAETLYSNIV